MERVIEATSRNGDWNSDAEKDTVMKKLVAAKAVYEHEKFR
jgi:hypothetical protein